MVRENLAEKRAAFTAQTPQEQCLFSPEGWRVFIKWDGSLAGGLEVLTILGWFF